MKEQTPQQEIAYLTAKVDGIIVSLHAFAAAHNQIKTETETALKDVQAKIREIQDRIPK